MSNSIEVKVGIAGLLFVLFIMKPISQLIAKNEFYSQGQSPSYKVGTVNIENFRPDGDNRCRYQYHYDRLPIAIPSDIGDYYTCCDWPEINVPIKEFDDRIEALCGVWPNYSVISIKKPEHPFNPIVSLNTDFKRL